MSSAINNYISSTCLLDRLDKCEEFIQDLENKIGALGENFRQQLDVRLGKFKEQILEEVCEEFSGRLVEIEKKPEGGKSYEVLEKELQKTISDTVRIEVGEVLKNVVGELEKKIEGECEERVALDKHVAEEIVEFRSTLGPFVAECRKVLISLPDAWERKAGEVISMKLQEFESGTLRPYVSLFPSSIHPTRPDVSRGHHSDAFKKSRTTSNSSRTDSQINGEHGCTPTVNFNLGLSFCHLLSLKTTGRLLDCFGAVYTLLCLSRSPLFHVDRRQQSTVNRHSCQKISKNPGKREQRRTNNFVCSRQTNARKEKITLSVNGKPPLLTSYLHQFASEATVSSFLGFCPVNLRTRSLNPSLAQTKVLTFFDCIFPLIFKPIRISDGKKGQQRGGGGGEDKPVSRF